MNTEPLAAGHEEHVPRAFLMLFDMLALAIAFVVTRTLAPWVHWLLLSHASVYVVLPEWLVLPDTIGHGAFPSLASMAWVLVVTIPCTVFFMELLGGYRQMVDQSRTRLAAAGVVAPLMALSVVALTLFALKISSSSRIFIFTFGGLSVLGLLAYRSSLRLYKTRRLAAGAYAKNVLIVGQPHAVAWMCEHFRQNVPANRFQLIGWLSARRSGGATAPAQQAAPASAEAEWAPLPCLGTVDQLGATLVHRPAHEIIAIQSAGDRDWITDVIDDCDYFRVCLRLVPEALLLGTPRDLKLVFRSEPLRLPEIVLAPPHLESDALFLKRLLDVVISASLLVLLAPLFLLIAIAIKLTSPGLPVFYPWQVVGLKGRPFTGFKFTTMVAGAEGQLSGLAGMNEMVGPVFKVKDDPRVTPLGRILRKYSVNELPQLLSVLKGDMSLVGPRPAFRHELDRYQLWHKRKLCVKPGMTCLWQVSGRNRIADFDDWVLLDLEYIDKWSPWLDLRILARTVGAVLAGSGS